jgi:hypothetical protein|tara:strand:+ start:1217 stop:1654 length:438 start_codon:yes stop_codon:yes gene_type:complete
MEAGNGGAQIGHGISHTSKALMENNIAVKISKGVTRLLFASQVLIVMTLAIIVFTLLVMSYRINYSVNWYYEAAYPYLNELSSHSMSIMRHADTSTASLEGVMSEAYHLASTAAPELIESVNKTVEMVARLQEATRNPTIKLSMG